MRCQCLQLLSWFLDQSKSVQITWNGFAVINKKHAKSYSPYVCGSFSFLLFSLADGVVHVTFIDYYRFISYFDTYMRRVLDSRYCPNEKKATLQNEHSCYSADRTEFPYVFFFFFFFTYGDVTLTETTVVPSSLEMLTN